MGANWGQGFKKAQKSPENQALKKRHEGSNPPLAMIEKPLKIQCFQGFYFYFVAKTCISNCITYGLTY